MSAGDEECLGFVRGQANLPPSTPCSNSLQRVVDALDGVPPVVPVTSKGDGAVVSVSMGLRDELENVVEINIS